MSIAACPAIIKQYLVSLIFTAEERKDCLKFAIPPEGVKGCLYF
jgi:hypothetical protein